MNSTKRMARSPHKHLQVPTNISRYQQEPWVCKAILAAFIFCFQSPVFWMFVEGIYLYSKVGSLFVLLVSFYCCKLQQDRVTHKSAKCFIKPKRLLKFWTDSIPWVGFASGNVLTIIFLVQVKLFSTKQFMRGKKKK